MPVIGLAEFSSASSLPEPTKAAVQNFERATWAANLSTPDLEPSWRRFIGLIERNGVGQPLSEESLVGLLQYLSTVDCTKLIASIGQQSAEAQVKFISMLNWLSQNATQIPAQDAAAASSVLQRLLMSARMSLYPKVYQPERIQRIAIALMSQQKKS